MSDAKAVWAEVKYTLKFPVMIGDAAPVTTITLREPDIEALEAMDDLNVVEGKKMTVKQTKVVICVLSGQPAEVINKVHRDDYIELVALTVPLVSGKTAETP